MLVSGWQQAVAVILAIVPGFIYQGTRAWWSGPNPADRDFGIRIVRALAFSGAAALVYATVLGRQLTDLVRQPVGSLDHPRGIAVMLLVLVFVVPFAVATVCHLVIAKRAFPQIPMMKLFALFDPTPTAWDYATRRLEPGAVRILTKEGTWIGGVAAEDAFFTGYPEPREVFLEEAYALDEAGAFKDPVPGTTGMWIRCDDVRLVQFLSASDTGSKQRDDRQTEEVGDHG